MAKPLKDKFAIAAALQEIGALLELKGGQYFKARAYKAGARAVAELSEDIGKLIKQNRLTFVRESAMRSRNKSISFIRPASLRC